MEGSTAWSRRSPAGVGGGIGERKGKDSVSARAVERRGGLEGRGGEVQGRLALLEVGGRRALVLVVGGRRVRAPLTAPNRSLLRKAVCWSGKGNEWCSLVLL